MQQPSDFSQQFKQINRLEKQVLSLRDEIGAKEHEKRKQILEIRTQLQFERRRFVELQVKYEEQLMSGEETAKFRELSNQLSAQLNQKESEIQEIKKRDFERKKRITDLENELEQLKNNTVPPRSAQEMEFIKGLIEQNNALKEEIVQFRQGALNAIIEKDTEIQELSEKLRQFQNADIAFDLAELRERYAEKQQLHQKEIRQFEQNLYHKQTELNQFKQRLDQIKLRYQQRITILSRDIEEYEVSLERLKQEKIEEDNLTEALDSIQQKNMKYQKRISDLEEIIEQNKIRLSQESKKYQNDTGSLKAKLEQMKSLGRQLQKQKVSKKTLADQITGFMKKVETLESEKKLILKTVQDYKDMKTQIEELKRQNAEILQDKHKIEESLKELRQNFKIVKYQLQEQKINSPARSKEQIDMQKSSEEWNVKTETLGDALQLKKNSFSQRKELLQDRIQQLQEELSKAFNENQKLRADIIKAKNTENPNKKYLIEIENLKQHVQKFENSLLIQKLKNAEDEYFWKERNKQDRAEWAKKQTQFNKQKIELYQKIQRLRKLRGERKSQYYKTSFK